MFSALLLAACIARTAAEGSAGLSSSLGILNATADCEVDNGGAVDVTAPLQACITKAYLLNLALFLPPGRYLVSDTLAANQSGGGADAVNIVPCRFKPNTIIGSTAALPQRPTIVLQAGSAGFGDASAPKNVLKISNPSSEDINMNQAIRGVDFEVEHGNPGAIALFFHGAQGGVIQDVTVRLASDAFAGFGGGGGAGTSHINIEVIGGVHGIYFLQSEPTPVLANARLHNQSSTAIVASHEQTLVIAGLHIARAANATGPTILAYWSGHQNNAQLSINDCVIECGGDGTTTAISATTSIYMRNVYTTNCAAIADQPGSRHAPVLAVSESTGSSSSGWSVVHELARGVDCPASMADLGKVNVTMDVIVTDGIRKLHGTVHNVSTSLAPDSAVLDQHRLWDESTFPSFERSTTANVVLDCGAKGDGRTDDWQALTMCLQKHQDVFLPKGRYRLSQTLDLNDGNRLLGLGQTLSVLMPVSSGFGSSDSIDSGANQKPLVRTAMGTAVTIAFVGIVSWWHLPVYTLHYRSKSGLWRNNYETRVCECLWLNDYGNATTACTTAVQLAVPKTKVQGTGSFVNYVSDEDILMTDHISYRHLHVSYLRNSHNATDRLRFYMLNLEHGQSQANFEIQNASFVDVYGIKLEGSTTIMWVRDSYDVNLWGLGGSGDSFPNCGGSTGIKCKIPFDFRIPPDFPKYNYSTIRVERTNRYKLVSLINNDRGVESAKPQTIHAIHPVPLTAKDLSDHPWPAADIPLIAESMWSPWPGYALPPSFWSVVGEMNGENDPQALLSAPLDRPILWQRGHD